MSSGKELVLCALGLRDWVAAQDKALADYKRRQIKTWTENADLLPEENRTELIHSAFERAEKLTAESLPEKQVKDPDGKIESVDYSSWWMADTIDGKIFAIWLSMRKSPGQETLLLNDIDAMFSTEMIELHKVANIVGELSIPKLGNSEAPPKREGRKRRRNR
jgi:hypothetical protein